jgi:hypothetical protein
MLDADRAQLVSKRLDLVFGNTDAETSLDQDKQ